MRSSSPTAVRASGGEKIYLIGQPIGMSQFFKLLGRYTPR